MITLSDPSHSIDVTMTAVTTNQVEYYAAYADEVFTAPGSHAPAPAATSLSGPGPSTVLSAPAAGVVRQLKYLSIANKDTVANTQNIQFNVGGTRRTIIQVTLQPGESLHYLNDASWRTYTSTGAVKAVAGDFVGPNGATDNAICRFDTTTGKLGQNSLVTIDDTGNIVMAASATVDGVDIDFTRVRCVVKSADQSVSSVTPANCTDLSFTALVAGTYWYRFIVYYLAAATTTGLKLAVDYTGTVTRTRYGANIPRTLQAADWQTATADAGALTVTDTTSITVPNFAVLEGLLTASTGGDLNLQFAGDVAASITVQQSSWGSLQRIS